MLILMALPAESQGLIEKWTESQEVPLIFTGMGLINATQKTTQAIQKFNPHFVLNLGTAGSRQHKVGELVECTELLRRDQTLSLLNKKISINGFSNLPKTSCGSADFVDSSESISQFGVVDMEAYAIVTVCKNLNIECGFIKFVSDVSGHDVKKQWEENAKSVAKALHQFLTEHFRT